MDGTMPKNWEALDNVAKASYVLAEFVEKTEEKLDKATEILHREEHDTKDMTPTETAQYFYRKLHDIYDNID